jgi:DNA polymerase-3 subunit alpha
MVRFAHLHVHSHYSILESPARIPELVAAAAAAEQPRLALTDSGNLYGAIQFYNAARAKNVTPILGCEVTVVDGDHRTRDAKAPTYPLVLLCENLKGWSNLIKLASRGFTEGFYFRPRVSKALLAEHAKGLIALSGDMKGELSRRVLANDEAGAARVIAEHREIFGRDGYAIEVMDTELPLQKRQRDGLLAIAEREGVLPVLTNDVHYLRADDAEAREVLMCVSSGKTLADENRWHLDTEKQYFRTTSEMATLFRGADRLCENAFEIASRCNVELKLDEFHLPHFAVPGGEDPKTYFRRLCRDGCIERYGTLDETIENRLRYEIEVIEEMGFVAYFLIVSDFIIWAKRNGIPVGPGRGSAAGSIVAYALQITDVDPLRYDLLFERFLNRGRISMPDIDIDFCRDERARVIDYVREKYGSECVCQIVTFGTLAAKAAVRDTGRVLGLDPGYVDKVAKKIPNTPGTKLKDAIEQDPELKHLRESDEQAKKLFRIALSIEGLNRHTSTHAAGVVITDRPLAEYAPLCVVQGEVNTQFAMTELESIGLLKMDFLGLKTLTVIARAEQLLRDSGIEIDCDRLPLDDRKTYEMLQRGETTGVFQLESSGMRELLQKMKPDVFEDIVAILALYRPGPLGSGMVETFVNRKHGREPIEYPHPSLEPILQETYGVMVYQEQIMRISNVLAGFTLEEADNLRKAMGKKKPEVMEKFKGKFVKGAVERGCAERIASEIWETMAYFAGYGFNKSHTVAYGLVTYQTAYLKANHPSQFLAASMSIDRGDTDKVGQYLADCAASGIQVLGPDANVSDIDFTIEDRKIRFGLGAIKGVGEKAVEAVLEARRALGRPFKNIVDFFENVDLGAINKAVCERLAAAGAFDWTGLTRAGLTSGIETLLKIGQNVQRAKKSRQRSLFDAFADDELPDFKPSNAEEWTLREKLKREKEALGFYVSGHPLDRYGKDMSRFEVSLTSTLPGMKDWEPVKIAGMVEAYTEKIPKGGKGKIALFKLEDVVGRVSVKARERQLADYHAVLTSGEPVLLSGKLSFPQQAEDAEEGDSGPREPTLFLNEARLLSDAIKSETRNVTIRLQADRVKKEQLAAMGKVLKANPGTCPVSLVIDLGDSSEALMSLPEMKVEPCDAVLAGLERVFGEKVADLH